MPHVVAAVMPIIQLIEKLMPLIEKFIDMISGNNGAVDTYNNSNKTDADKKTFLDSLNKELEALKKAADEDDIVGNEFTIPDKIDSQVEVDDMIKALEDIKAKSPALADKIDKLIDALKDVRSSLPYSDPGASGTVTQTGTGDSSEVSAGGVPETNEGLALSPGSVNTSPTSTSGATPTLSDINNV
jgi:hypothetical protein